ncbi:phage major capsid protein [Paenibacillus dendritiformis]|uniref:phage major capsid protein n=1 Tax=Paenibacillus dendritiformis TaxID=130049 RepID=UPI003665CBA0
MNKKKLLELIAKKEARKAELAGKANTSEDVKELRSINAELETLNGEIVELRGIVDAMDEDEEAEQREQTSTVEGQEQRGGSPVGRTQILASYGLGTPSGEEQRNKDLEQKYEQRGADLKAKRAVEFELDELPEFRAVTIGAGTLVVPKHYSDTLNPTFNEVSSLIDTVNAIPLNGGESYEKGFVIGYGEGDYTTETGDYEETDPKFGYVSIGKAKITAYTEMSDESLKLPNINYQSLVAKNISTAIRKKISRQIVAGAGGANAITGIFKAPANVIPTESDIEIANIDETTLDKIVFSYGGEEDVEGGAYLILSKKDLAAFAAIRGNDGKKLYNITLNGNTGTISSDASYSVNFIINSACPSLSDAGTAADTYCMAYGMPRVYELPIFSALTVEESRDYKFRSGQVAFRGSIWVGGNVAAYKGFNRIKKVTAT